MADDDDMPFYIGSLAALFSFWYFFHTKYCISLKKHTKKETSIEIFVKTNDF
jgi:hypothetical protein